LCSSGCIGKQRDLIAKNNFSQGHFRFSQKHALCFDSFWTKKRPRIRERAMRSRISRGASNYVTGGVDFWSSHCYINHFRGFHFSAFSLLRRLVNARVSFISLSPWPCAFVPNGAHLAVPKRKLISRRAEKQIQGHDTGEHQNAPHAKSFYKATFQPDIVIPPGG
jgi:hypothetical protein